MSQIDTHTIKHDQSPSQNSAPFLPRPTSPPTLQPLAALLELHGSPSSASQHQRLLPQSSHALNKDRLEYRIRPSPLQPMSAQARQSRLISPSLLRPCTSPNGLSARPSLTPLSPIGNTLTNRVPLLSDMVNNSCSPAPTPRMLAHTHAQIPLRIAASPLHPSTLVSQRRALKQCATPRSPGGTPHRPSPSVSTPASLVRHHLIEKFRNARSPDSSPKGDYD